MTKYLDWTYAGQWASFDAFFRTSSDSFQVSEIKSRVREELTKKTGSGYSPRTQSVPSIVNSNAMLVKPEVLDFAQGKLIKIARANGYDFTNGGEYHLHGMSLNSLRVYMGDRIINIKDTNSRSSSEVSDNLMFLAERLSLPIPPKVEKRWVEQMKKFADQQYVQLKEFADKEKKSQYWILQNLKRSLKNIGYFEPLRRTKEYSF